MAGAMRRARKRTAPDPGLPNKAGAILLSVCQTWHRGTGRGEVRHRTPNMHPHEAERDMNEGVSTTNPVGCVRDRAACGAFSRASASSPKTEGAV